jgi:precorrin-2 dehydrogenase / sirohydrochlorin ferrochelatase
VTYPVMLDGARFTAVVIGGGEVAARKTRALIDGGVQVTVVAPRAVDELSDLAGAGRIRWEAREARDEDVASATIVVAATDSGEVNRRFATIAAARGVLVNVVDDPATGNFVTPSVHRAGDLTIAVSTGRAPAAAAAIRANIGQQFDHRYADAIGALRALRDRLFAAGQHEDWRRASSELIGDNFCADVENGALQPRIVAWR